MKVIRPTMTLQEFDDKVKILVEKIGDHQRLKPGENAEIFDLHNLGVENKWIKGPIETGRSCSGCIARTYKRLRAYADSI